MQWSFLDALCHLLMSCAAATRNTVVYAPRRYASTCARLQHTLALTCQHTQLLLYVFCRRLLCLFGAGGEHLFTLGADSGSAQLQQLSWLGDNEVLACSGEEITVWNVTQEQYKELRTFAASNKAPIRHIATSPNGRFIAAACDNGAVSMGTWVQRLSLDCQGRECVLSDGSSRAQSANYDTGT